MNGSSKLSLAVALALFGGNAFALGLGSIQLNSKLDQPLNAEIPVLSATAAEVNVLKVGLASAEDFERVGLSRARVSVPLEFSVTTDSAGQPVIKVTTKDIVREPFLDFLVEVNWPKGKVLREYTVLLDPPVMAPALRGSTASVSPAHEAAPAHPQRLAERPHAKPAPIRTKPPHTVAHAKPATPAKAQHAAAAHTASAGQYGPVAQGETLSEIARATRPDESTNLDKVMLAMLKANPNAFFKDNINALKRGAILRIPSADEIKATGSALEAAAQVRDQNQSWSSNTPVSKPTLVAKTGAPKKSPAQKHPVHSASRRSSSGSAHLALVPPRAGKDNQATADRPGAASGSANAASAAQLARTKEALASRDQEVGDLKSRVKELEDLHSKDQRLISLKQSELAQLQEKLKQLNAAKAATPAVAATAAHAAPTQETPKPAATTTTPAPGSTPKLTEKDIWGDISSSEKAAPAKSATAAGTTTVTPAKPGTETAAQTPAPGATPTTAPSSTSSLTPPPASTTATTAATPNNSSVTPTTTPKPAAQTTPVKSKPVAKPEPLAPPGVPWYQNQNVLMGGGIALIVIGLLALMRFMRKPKLAPALADADAHATGMDAFGVGHDEEEEHQLLDQLAQHPGDPQLSLELLSLYYSHNDADKFEAAAEAMYAHVSDSHQAEWQQVCAMGKELCPHNPLFDEHADVAGFDHAAHSDAGHDEMDHLNAGLHDHGEAQEDHFGSFDSTAKTEDDEGFDFDLTDHTATSEPAHEPESSAPAHEEELALPDLSDHPTPPPPPSPPPPADTQATQTMAVPAEDFFAGEDAIGTKLDLAKAYLDMGDPEGARSMLDEVMAEGNDAQKDEARKLLAEIH
ncbi:MAG: FimV/HubP family polar landmark protein [Rudaea sp.]